MSLENIRNSEGRPRQRIDYGLVPGGKPTLGAWLLAIPANARYPEVAEEFLQWATDKDQMTNAAYQGNPPPVRGLLESDKALQKRFYFYEAQRQALANAHPRPRTPCWKDLETQIGRTLYQMTAGQFTAQAAQARINEELAASPCSVSEK
jgi:multiple sugar transport system substrate-binding protein